MKTIYLLGDVSELPIATLVKSLVDGGAHVRFPTQGDKFSVALLCLTKTGVSADTWRIIEANRGARIFPVLFEGGVLPAIFADLKPADVRSNPEKALVDLVRAIEKFC